MNFNLPPNPKLNFDSEMMFLLSETEKILSQIELLRSVVNPIFFDHLIICEAINNYNLDYRSGWSFESYLTEANAENDINKILTAGELAQKIIKDVKPTHLIKTIYKELTDASQSSAEFRTGEKKNSYNIPDSSLIEGLMSQLENYLLENSSYHPLVNAALIHAQFELIHPFSQYNGIVGRVLLHLNFIWKKKLSLPVLQVSSLLSAKKIEYFDRLEDLTRNNNWNGWVKFMLRIFCESSSQTITLIKKITTAEKDIYNTLIEKNIATTASLKTFELLKRKPVITINQFTKDLNYSKQTINFIVTKFLEEKVLEEVSGKQRYRVFKCKTFLEALN